ncbi:MAG: CTP synthase, partial [Phycisphaerae bacterium]
AYYIEALRQLAYEEGPGSCCWVALTYILEPPALGEQKSKAAQLGIKQLMEAGIQSHIIACRAIHPVARKAREKIALYSSVPFDRVFSMHDCESVYVIPEMLRDAGLDRAVVDILGIADRVHPEAEATARQTWNDYLSRLRGASETITIGIAGKYTSVRDSYASIIKALEHCGTRCDVKVSLDWIDTSDMEDKPETLKEKLAHLHGLIIPGGFGARGAEGKIAVIRHARTTGLPTLGLCLGFQLAVVEYARNVCELAGAGSTEFDNECPHPIIDILPDQKQIEGLGGNMRLGGRDVVIAPNSLVARLFNNAPEIRLRFRHRYEVDPRYVQQLEDVGLIFSGRAPDYPIMQVLELSETEHPFFIATQAHPELTSRPLRPDPFFLGLVRAAVDHLRAATAGSAVRTQS